MPRKNQPPPKRTQYPKHVSRKMGAIRVQQQNDKKKGGKGK